MFKPEIQLVHADNRGEIYSISLPDNRELILLHSKPGAFRGGHSHDCKEFVMLLSGRMRYHKRAGDMERTFELWGGDGGFNEPDEIHMGEFLEDTWLLEYKFAKKGEWTQEDFQPYREKVRASQR